MTTEGGTSKLPSAKKNDMIMALATTIIIAGCIAVALTIRPSTLSIDTNGEMMRDNDDITAKSNIRSMSTKSKPMRFNSRLKPFG